MLLSVSSLKSFPCTPIVRRRARERIQKTTKKKMQLSSRTLTRRARKAL
jgi:hypothetical protein